MGVNKMNVMQSEIADLQYQLQQHHDEMQKLSYRLETLNYISNGFAKHSASDIKDALDKGAVLEIPGTSIYILKYNGVYKQVSVFRNNDSVQIYVQNYTLHDGYTKEAENSSVVKFLVSIETLEF